MTGSNPSALDVINAVKEHRRTVLDREPEVLLVPEWPVGGEPLKVHVWPATIAEEAEINRSRQQAAREGADPAYAEVVATVIVRAKHADRSQIFAWAQRHELMGGIAEPVRRLCSQINAVDLTPEELEGN